MYHCYRKRILNEWYPYLLINKIHHFLYIYVYTNKILTIVKVFIKYLVKIKFIKNQVIKTIIHKYIYIYILIKYKTVRKGFIWFLSKFKN